MGNEANRPRRAKDARDEDHGFEVVDSWSDPATTGTVAHQPQGPLGPNADPTFRSGATFWSGG